MLASVQAIHNSYIAEIRASGRIPQLLDYAHARRHAAEVQARQAQEAAEAAKATARDPYGLGALLAELRALDTVTNDPELDALLDGLDAAVPADNDNTAPELDALLDGLPVALPHVLAPIVVPEVVTNAPARTRRKKVRSGLRQREDARDMRAQGRAADEEAVEHLPTPSTSSTSPTSTSSTTTPTAQDDHANDNDDPTTTQRKSGRGRLIASWDNAGDLPRIIAINRGLDRFGVPMAFSLNIAPDLIKAGNDNARGQLDYHRRRLALALKRTFGDTPPMWVAIETEDDGRQHLHGGIALTDRHDLDTTLKTLSKACGDWTTQGSAPAHMKVQDDPDGWAVYPFKRSPRTRRDLREAAGLPLGARVSLYAASADLLAAGRRIHEESRRAIGRR